MSYGFDIFFGFCVWLFFFCSTRTPIPLHSAMPRRVSSASSSLQATAGSSSSSASPRGPRPAKSANCIAPASPSPDSSSDNASDNSDLFQWTPSGVEKHLASASSASSSTASASRSSAGQQHVSSPSSASLTASRLDSIQCKDDIYLFIYFSDFKS